MRELFIVEHNMAGYSPEADPVAFESFADAKGHVIDELKHIAGSHWDMTEPGDETYATDLERCADELSKVSDDETGWSDMVDAVRYWQAWSIIRDTVDDETAAELMGDS